MAKKKESKEIVEEVVEKPSIVSDTKPVMRMIGGRMRQVN